VTATSTLPAPPDSELIHRYLRGEEAAFRLLYNRHTPRLRMTLQRLLAARSQETDDVVQETWLSACRGMRNFRGDAKFSTWLTSIGVRAALAQLARHRPQEIDLVTDVPSREGGQVIAAIDVERALAHLPEQQRLVVVLHDLEGFTHEEIGAQLGIATGTSKVTLHRARSGLRNTFAPGVTNAS
jgi:RNA polymerase sigma-70 factor (ECF subfamily)